MTLPEELEQAAQHLGRSLRESSAVRLYLEAQARLEADAEAGALDRQLQELYRRLQTRQQAGEALPPAEVDAFSALQARVQRHPLVAERDLALNELKSYLVEVAWDLSNQLGLDYSLLAGPG